MNYRHAYHAGNFADVLKHGLLCWAIAYLQQKVAPLWLLDTHAGAGIYDLSGTEARKTGEAAQGILKLVDRPDLPEIFAPYLASVRAANATGGLDLYPGSPWLMAHLARQGQGQGQGASGGPDRVTLGELHPAEAAALRGLFARQAPAGVTVVEGDGYATLQKCVPPREKRGLVLIDPPFEATDEFERLAAAFVQAHRKWPGGVYLLWFPVKDRALVAKFVAELAGAGIPKLSLVTLDVGVPGDGTPEGLHETGLVLCNAPWTLEQDWEKPLAWLAGVLARGPGASAAIRRLTPA